MYDFTKVVDRSHMNSVKWQGTDNELPLSIADMEFAVAPEIVKAMHTKLTTPYFGYEYVPLAFFQAISEWYQTQHQTQISTAWMLFCNGVVPALSSMIRRLSQPGDQVVVQTPVYDIFFHSIENNGRHVVESPLSYDPQQAYYSIDWADLEAKLAQPLSKIMLLCNPHNPIGRVWSRVELQNIIQLCQQYHVWLISDEIHGDLVLGQPAYTPVAALPPALLTNVAACVSPSKTFNLAALHSACVIVPDPDLRATISRGFNNDELAEPNLLAVPATIAAYQQGQTWLQELLQVLTANRQQVTAWLNQLPVNLQLASANATYLLWFDVSSMTANAQELATFIKQQTGLILNAGNVYRGNGAHFLRLNSACPPAMLKQALSRFQTGLINFVPSKNH